MDARRATFHRGPSLFGDLDCVPRPLLDRVRPKRLTSNDDLHVQWLGGVLKQELGVALTICVLMAPRARCLGVGEVGSRRLVPSPDRRRRPPRRRGPRSDSRLCRRSRLTFALSVHVTGCAQSRVGRSYMACIAGSIISKETAPFAATFTSPLSVDLSNTSWWWSQKAERSPRRGRAASGPPRRPGSRC